MFSYLFKSTPISFTLDFLGIVVQLLLGVYETLMFVVINGRF